MLTGISIALFALPTARLFGQAVNVPTWRYDNTHQGQNTQETILTPTNVNTNTFGRLFSQAVDGNVYAQPLYVSNLTINGAAHNVVFVATEHDSVYAFDADSNGGSNSAPLWQQSMLSTAHGAASGATTVPTADVQSGTGDIHPEIGITGTPVIDAGTQTIFVVSKSKESGNYVQRLHALNILNGSERTGSPVVLAASVPGNGTGSSGGTLTFSSLWQNNRPALSFFNGNVYIAFASHGDDGPFHGWVLVYNEATLQQTAAICLSPNGYGSGIWSSGAGLPIDTVTPNGRMFLVTGNGDLTTYPPLNNTADYGMSILRYDLSNNGFAVSDAFTTFNEKVLSGSDLDQGSGGILMLPDQPGPYPHLLLQIGKEGRILILNRDNLNGFAGSNAGSNTNAVQDITGVIKVNQGLWSTPAYWNGYVYLGPDGDTLKAFPLTNGKLATSPSSVTSESYYFPGVSPVVSSNGTQNGIVWALETDESDSNGPAILKAYNALNLGQILYNSQQNTTRDNPGPAIKFTVPVVTNGKVYVGTGNAIGVFGLLNQQPQAPAPSISPGGNNYSTPQQISITDSVSGASIFYTVGGSAPTATSPKYTAPFTLSSSATVQAIASATGYLQSAVTSATYSFTSQTAAPQFSPAPGNFTTVQTVTMTDTTPNAAIYYTTDGSMPTVTSTRYSLPIQVGSPTSFNAIAIASGLNNSPVSSATYAVQLPGTSINYANGFANATGITLNGSATDVDDTRLQLTTGVANQAGSVFYNTLTNIQGFTTDFSFQLSNATADGFTFTIQNAGLTALGGGGASLGYGTIGKSVAIKFDFNNNAGEGSDSTGLYVNGAVPTVPAVDMTSSGVILNSGDSISAHITYDGANLVMTLTDGVVNKVFTYTWQVNIPSTVGGNTAYIGFTGASGSGSASQKILSWTLSSQAPTAAATAQPTFSPAAGTYSSAQSVSLSDTTTGAVLYYTTDGSTPTTASAVYSGTAIPVAANATLKAIAIATSYAQSAVASAAYIIQSPAATPTFTPTGGTYTSAQSVTIADTTPGTTIYYTTNGATPTTASAVYSAVIPVAANATLKAIATATSYAQSAVASAAYVIQSPAATPTLTPAGGTYTSAQSVTITDTTPAATIYYTTNGATPTTASAVYSGTAIPVAANATLKAIAVATSYAQSAVASAAYVIQYPAATPTLTPAGGTYTSAQSVTIADTTPGASIYYTTNGATPTTASTVYGGTAIPVAANATLKAIATATSYAPSAVASAAYVIQSPAATPTFTPAGGTYNSAQSVTIADTTPSVTIYYTTNGATPTTASTVYSGTAIPVAANATLKAIATATSYAQSAVASAVYVIQSAAATPTFTPAGGTYTSAQSVTIADTTPATTIYYTTNGATPTTASAVYSGTAIPVTANATLKAIATATSYAPSAVASAAYVIQSPAATPTFTPAGGTYNSAQSVTIADTTPGATIYYTTNGATPTTASAVYGAAIPVTATTTVQAIAVATSYAPSAVASAAYVIQSLAATPTFTPAGGTYNSAQSVTIADTTPGATIYFTTNGATPTTASTVYSGTAIPVTANVTLKAIATATAYAPSAVASAAYVIQSPAATPTFNPAGGTYTSTQSVTIADTTPGATIYYTTNGATPTTASAVYGVAIPVTATTTVQAIAVATSYAPSAVASATYVIQSPAATPTFTPAGGTYTSAQSVTIADTTPGATIYYTTNGATPTTASAVYSGAAIPVAANSTLNAIATATSYAQSAVASAAYVIQSPAATPTFTPAGGTYNSAQSVTIADTTPGATIYYTTNGATPTTASAVYSGTAILVAANATLKAIATATSYASSAVASAAYVIQFPAAAPSFTPAGGTYASAQSVTIADTTPGATIYYTTNGATPTTASAVYSGTAIPVAANATLQAIAVATSYAPSAVASAAYVIQSAAATPTFTPGTGTYATAQSVTIADSTPGASIYYTTNGSTPTTASTLYSAPIFVGQAETIQAIAVAPNYGNSAVGAATYTAANSGTSVNLSSAFNTYGIFNSGTLPTNGGVDGTGYAYAGSTLPTGITLGGVPVTLGPVAAPDAIRNATVALPRGQYNSVSVLAAASYGPLLNQTFIVTYSDGTTSTFTQSISDWGRQGNYPGETTVVTDSQRIIPSGALQAGPWYMYGYTFSLSAGKTVSSITLPARSNVFVFAITLQ